MKVRWVWGGRLERCPIIGRLGKRWLKEEDEVSIRSIMEEERRRRWRDVVCSNKDLAGLGEEEGTALETNKA